MSQLMAFIFILYSAFGLLCFFLYGSKLTTSVISEGIKDKWYSIPFGLIAQVYVGFQQSMRDIPNRERKRN